MDTKTSALALWRVWAGIGLQSFGGGASTQLLIRRAFVEKRDWVTSEELTDFWNLCQFTPGINLIALTILIGRKLAGTRGILASLAGMLLPSATVTCCLTIAFQSVHRSPIVHAVIRGVVPATAGIMGVVALGFARPLWNLARAGGVYEIALSAAVVSVSALAIILLKLPVMFVVIGVALVGVGVFTPRGEPRSNERAGNSERERTLS